MTAYIKAIATNYNEDGLSWHKEDGKNESIIDTDNVTSAMQKANMLQIDVANPEIVMNVNGTEIKSGKKGVVLTGVPWTENGLQDLERQVDWCGSVSNARYAEILDPLAQTYNVGSVLHCGPLGEVLAIQLKMPDFYVDNKEAERHTTYLLVAENRKDGKKHYMVTTVRVVCANTYGAAVNGVKSMPNSKDSELMLMFRTSLERSAIKSREDYIRNMDNLFTRKVDTVLVDKVAQTLFPMPKRPSFLDMTEKAREDGYDFSNGTREALFATRKESNVTRDFQAAMDRQEGYLKAFYSSFYTFNDEYSYAGNTAYALWNACTDVQKASSDIYGRTKEDVATFNLLFGNRAKSLDSVYALLTK